MLLLDLRKKILALGDNATLDNIILEANALETVGREMEGFSTPSCSSMQISNSVNKVFQDTSKFDCSCCGRKGHLPKDKSCPARNKDCLKCGRKGHFQICCRTKVNRKRNVGFNRYKNNKKPRTEETDYVFHIDDDCLVQCKIGNVPIELLIDSGSKSNLITGDSWEFLKENKVHVWNQIKNPEKCFVAYASNTPLTVLGAFDAEISIGDQTKRSTFYVIKNGSKNLLGKETAMALGVLKIGLEINSIEVFPKFKDVLIDIPIDKNIKPVCQPYRRIPIPLEAKVEKKINELIELDIIEPVNGPSRWVSPMVPILKQNGDIRICIDMRRANTAIIRENHPLPTMNGLLPHLRKAKLFSRLDIKNAFHQVEISPESREITTFITNKGLFRYKRLLFGISCAPELFQKIMERILMGLKGVISFIDDIVIFGSNETEHDNNLDATLKRLKENYVLLNSDKCAFKIKEITFLGHVLSSKGVRPLDNYIESIRTFRAPKTIEELQSFLGLINFIGKWIPHLATLTEPFRKLLRLKLSKTATIANYWTSAQKKCFLKLKDQLSLIRSLGYYDSEERTQVFADASPVGLGAVLVQINQEGSRIIAFGNKSLSDCEKRYCQTEKEALALVWAVEHFRIYLFGKTFELVTDHKPLEAIFGPNSKPCARIERWVLRLQSYKFKVVYKPGKNNIADPLSRLCIVNSEKTNFDSDEYVHSIVQFTCPVAISLNQIKECSKSDHEISKVKRGLYENVWDDCVKKFRMFENELCFYDNILLRGNKIVIPVQLRKAVLEAAHEGHPGIAAMKARLRTKVWWPNIDTEAEKIVKNCKGCTLVSAPNPPNPIKRREFPAGPWIDVATDFMGPLPNGYHLFVIVDYYSRYKEIKIMKTITAADTIRVLREVFSRLGNPVSITADNGKQFSCSEMRSFCSERAIILHHTIPYWPQQNGEVERQNKDILKRLKISHSLKKDWITELQNYLVMYNSTPHSTTGKTPAELFFNRQFRDKIPSLIGQDYRGLDGEVRDKDHMQKEIGKEYANKKRKAKENDLDRGDKVYVKNLIKHNKLTSDFGTVPYTVVNKKGGDIELENSENGERLRRNVVHLKRVEGEWQVCKSPNTKNIE
ncbi:uncharacterized protein K02A2.6-like [Sitophilus oryzae]|uniref:RNA-directed DNA polymerase n=1 Tax=Sitophilus oryzae TaxID=7048 RepID=A0A6J2XHH4_SITOR|nr:uncharacterized protein K02A2.6-like [Sitophilus oryzae]